MNRVRLTKITVQVESVLDNSDLDTLTPLQPVTVSYPPGDWPLFDLDRTRDAIQRKVDTELTEAPEDEPAALG